MISDYVVHRGRGIRENSLPPPLASIYEDASSREDLHSRTYNTYRSRPTSSILPEGFTIARIRRDSTSSSLMSLADLYDMKPVYIRPTTYSIAESFRPTMYGRQNSLGQHGPRLDGRSTSQTHTLLRYHDTRDSDVLTVSSIGTLYENTRRSEDDESFSSFTIMKIFGCCFIRPRRNQKSQDMDDAAS